MAETRIVSYSELDCFRQCPLKHALAYKMRYTKAKELDSALGKGTLWHLVMEFHYRRIREQQRLNPHRRVDDPVNVLRGIRAEVVQMLVDERTGLFLSDVHELILWMYDGYVQHYGVDSQWIIQAVEHQIVVPLRNRGGRQSRFHLKAKIDLVVQNRNDGTLWVVDHKSGQNLPTQMDLEIDDQFGLYTWAMREVNRKVTGSIHSAARTQRNQADWPEYVGKSKPQTLEQRFHRTYLNRSHEEVTNLALDAYNAAVAAYPADPRNAPLYSSPDPRQCGWKCDFKEVHLLMRRNVATDQAMLDYGFHIDKTRH